MFGWVQIVKPPIKGFRPVPAVCDNIDYPSIRTKEIQINPSDAKLVLKEISRQISDIRKHTALIPKTVVMGNMAYELILGYHYYKVNAIQLDTVLGLPINICSLLDGHCVEVQCSVREEMLYHEELKEIRHRR